MKNKEIVVVNKDTKNTIVNIFKFFMEHINIELDGETKVARIKYSGPNGWKVSLQSSYEKRIDVVETEIKN